MCHPTIQEKYGEPPEGCEEEKVMILSDHIGYFLKNMLKRSKNGIREISLGG